MDGQATDITPSGGSNMGLFKGTTISSIIARWDTYIGKQAKKFPGKWSTQIIVHNKSRVPTYRSQC